jgi:hypothetical protein
MFYANALSAATYKNRVDRVEWPDRLTALSATSWGFIGDGV